MIELASMLKDFLAIIQALGPLGIIFFLWWDGKKENKKWEERFQAVVRMYENNVELVKNYENFTSEQRGMCNYQQDIIVLNTGAITKLTTIIEERIK